MKLLNISFKKNEYKIKYIYLMLNFSFQKMNWMDGCFFFLLYKFQLEYTVLQIFLGKLGLCYKKLFSGPEAQPTYVCSLGITKFPLIFPNLFSFIITLQSPFPQKKEEKTSSTSSSFSVTARPNSSGSDLSRSHSLWFMKLGFCLFSRQTEERNWKGTWGPPFFFLVAYFLRKWESLFSQ